MTSTITEPVEASLPRLMEDVAKGAPEGEGLEPTHYRVGQGYALPNDHFFIGLTWLKSNQVDQIRWGVDAILILEWRLTEDGVGGEASVSNDVSVSYDTRRRGLVVQARINGVQFEELVGVSGIVDPVDSVGCSEHFVVDYVYNWVRRARLDVESRAAAGIN